MSQICGEMLEKIRDFAVVQLKRVRKNLCEQRIHITQNLVDWRAGCLAITVKPVLMLSSLSKCK